MSDFWQRHQRRKGQSALANNVTFLLFNVFEPLYLFETIKKFHRFIFSKINQHYKVEDIYISWVEANLLLGIPTTHACSFVKSKSQQTFSYQAITLAIMPLSAASIMIPAVRGAFLSRTSAAMTVAFRHMSAAPALDYVKVRSLICV